MKGLIFSILLCMLCNCGGGKGGAGNSPIQTEQVNLHGVLVDGYISGASVCIDKNLSGECDLDEPTTTTDQYGSFAFSNLSLNESSILPIIAIGGVDTVTNKPYSGELKKILDTSTENVKNTFAISPITDLTATQFLKSEQKNSAMLLYSKIIVSSVLQLAVLDLDKNPLTDKVIFSKVQEVENLKSLLQISALKSMPSLSSEQKANVQKNIVHSIVMQIENNFVSNIASITVAPVIDRLKNKMRESFPNFDIPINEKNFISAQVDEVNLTLAEISINGDTSKLNGYQAGLSDEMDAAKSALIGASVGSSITVSSISDDLNLLYKPTTISNGQVPTQDTNNTTTPTNSIPTQPPSVQPTNSLPIAIAGINFTTLSKLILLDGTKSTDPNNLTLTYSWGIIAKPLGSTASLSNSTLSKPILTLDKIGEYVIQLTVNNGFNSANHSITINLQKAVEYTHTLADNSVSLISDHLTKEAYTTYANGFYYDLSAYNSLQTTKVNSNGVRVEKINLASDSNENLNNYDTVNPIYRICSTNNICYRGLTNTLDLDKVLIEKLDHANKLASEILITSKSAGLDTYQKRSSWNLSLRNNNLYLYRKLYPSISAGTYAPFDTEIIKLNPSFQIIWDSVIKTSNYGTSPNIVESKDSYTLGMLPWLIFEYYEGKILIHNYTSGSRNGAENIILNDTDGTVEDVFNYLVYENNVMLKSTSFYPTLASNGKLYFSNYYNLYSGTKFSTTNGVVFFYIDSLLNPTSATAVTSADSSIYFTKSYLSNVDNVIGLTMISPVSGTIYNSKIGYLNFTDLTVDSIKVHHNLTEFWASDFTETLLNNDFNFKVNNNFYTAHLSYTDLFSTKASYISKIASLHKNFLSVRYGTSYFANDSIELDDFGLHPGCFEAATASTNTVTTLPFNSKTLEVRKVSYDRPLRSTRIVSSVIHDRAVTSVDVEERASWLCSSYALDLDTTVRLRAGSTVNIFTHDTGYYRYEVITQPTKGTLTIYQPANFTITGNTTVQYTANANASGTESFQLRAMDGTGSKILTVTIQLK